jgi:hypothetical protein
LIYKIYFRLTWNFLWSVKKTITKLPAERSNWVSSEIGAAANRKGNGNPRRRSILSQTLRGPRIQRVGITTANPNPGALGRKGDMKLILDTTAESQIARKPALGAFSLPVGHVLSGSTRRAIIGTQLQSLPPTDRERSSARARRIAPAPGLAGVLDRQMSRIEDANREWLIWRFGEDA